MHSIVLAQLVIAFAAQDAQRVDFARDIAPIFAQSCLQCHGAEKQKAGLRLDRRADALAGASFGADAVILPGRAAESPLYLRLVASDPDERMPRSGAPLSADEIEAIRAWIDAGAEWPESASASSAAAHWAYVSPVRPALPEVQRCEWVREPLDVFVLARLEREGLATAPEADRATLLRRLSLDLVGLPPTLAEIDAFLADEGPAAYDAVVERLLASPHFGEHWAAQWLDLARYADTNGYEKDQRRTMWRWRDWVVDAYNRDLAYDRFTLEQLAGDLLPDATLATRIATGFHRNTLVNEEGGTDPEEFRVAAVIDRVNTTGSVWLGSTIGCAQCHNHKYDPFSREDYYRLLAYFDSTADTGNALAPQIEAPTAEQASELEQREARIAALAERLGAADLELDAAHAAWERALAMQPDPSWKVLPPRAFAAANGTALQREADGSLFASGPAPASEVYELDFTPPAALPHERPHASPDVRIGALRLECLVDERLPGGGPGRSGNGNFVLTEVELAALDALGGARPIGLAWAFADHEQQNGDFRAGLAIDGKRASGWAAGSFERPGGRTLVCALAEPLVLVPGERLRVVLRQESQHAGHALGRVRCSVAERFELAPSLGDARSDGATLALLSDTRRAALARTPVAERTASEQAELAAWFRREVSPAGRTLAAELALARAELARMRAALPTALVLAELATPRTTHVFERGNFRDPREPVTSGVPAFLGSVPEAALANRLGLAQWIVDPRHPLTARVAVNRLWERLFGTGLVATSEDFGTRGDPPSHPELLDWLALELIESGWSTKSLLRTLVSSATYRQDSRVTRELRERDPGNRLLARGPRLRVAAEAVRDIALVASGLLDPRIGGPSVFPPQPDGVWNVVYNGDRWTESTGGDRHRRALYTFLRRTSPYPSLVTFDAPSRELSCARRATSNTPLQALVLLNDPVYVEAAGALAQRILAEVPASDDAAETDRARAVHGFRLCTARVPDRGELALLFGLLASERERFAREPEAARAWLAATSATCATAPDVELAAWAVVASALLNLDETITKG